MNQRYLPYTEHGGTVYKGAQLARHLSLRGYRVCTLTADLGRLEERLQEANMQRVPSEGSIVEGLKAGVETVVYLRSALRYHVVTVNPEILSFIIRELKGFDLVHIIGLYTLLELPVALGSYVLRIPYVVEPCGMVRAQQRSVLKKRAYLALVGRPLLARASKIIATSELERDALIDQGVKDRHIALRPNGIDLPSFSNLPVVGAFRAELGVAEDRPLVLFVGRISRIKGLDLAVRALALLPRSVVLAICGPDEADGHLEEVKSLAIQLGVDSRVRVLPARYGSKKLEAMVDANVVILSSHSENFGNAAAEALACGTPTVVTSGCGIAAHLSDRGGLVAERTPASFSSALWRVLFEPAASPRLADGAREVAAELSWESAIDRQEEIYRGCLEEARLWP